MKGFIAFIHTLTLLLFLQYSSSAVEIRHLDAEQGMINGSVSAMEKDNLGYMWVGTRSGLFRFSGQQFKQYTLSDNKANSFIVKLVNKNDRLFAFSRGGEIAEYNYDLDRFETLAHYPTRRFITAAVINEEEVIIGLRNGVVVFNLKTKKLSEKIGKETLSINRNIILSDQKIYISGASGLYELTKGKDNKYVIKDTLVSGVDIISTALDTKGRFWLASNNSKLYLYDFGKLSQIKIEGYPNGGIVRTICFDKDNNALLGVDGKGLLIVDQHFNLKGIYNHNPDELTSIKQNDLNYIYVDEQNAYWLGLKERGLDIFFTESNPFHNYQHILNKKNSLSDNFVRSIHQDQKGNIWFGTETGIDVVDQQGNWMKLDVLKDVPVLTLTAYKGKIIAGTYGEGSYAIDPVSYQYEKIFVSPIKENKHVFSVSVLENESEVWVGGNNAPLSLFENGKFTRSFSLGYVKTVIPWTDEAVLVGGWDGLFEIEKENDKVTRLPLKLEDGAKVDNIFYLKKDNLTESLWIGGRMGLLKYDTTTKTVEVIESNATIGIVYGIQLEEDGDLWLSSNKGLFKYFRKDKFLRRYNKNDGVMVSGFGFGATSQLSDGSIAFGGPEGVVSFKPSQITKNHQITEIFVEDFQVNGQTLPEDEFQNLNFKDHLELKYNQNTISFYFNALDLYGKNKNSIRYQLKGYDDKPLSLNEGQKITYTKLPSGEYTLVLDVINSDGIITYDAYKLNIDVKDPFWLTIYAFIIYIVLSFIGIYMFIQYQKARTNEKFSDEKVKFFIDVAHDIRTPVSLIQLSSDQILKGENQDNAISLIRRNTKHLNEYVTQLLDFQKAERNQLQLKVQEIDIKSLIDEILLDFKPMIDNKELMFTTSIPPTIIWFDKEKMIRVFNNLISNAIKYSNKGGVVKINLTEENGKLLINFIDNGIGIPENQQKKIFSRFVRANNAEGGSISGSGIGLLLSKKIVELHHGDLYFESKMDLGTKFTIELYPGKKHFSLDEIKKVIVEEEDHLPTLNITDEKTILVVEDNDDIRHTLVTELSKEYKIIEAPNGKEALVLALEKRPDLILTDVMMPLMSGKELCHIIKNNYKTSHIPVVMLTALSRVEDKIEGLELGADAYVEKPFRLEMLKITIGNLLKSRHLMKKLINEADKDKQEETVSIEQDFLSKVVEEIKSNVTNKDFNIVTLCENMGYSRSNLFRKLKKHSGMSPSDLITKIRINHAVELFKTRKDLRVADVAYESGFNDPKYFSTTFKKHIGKSPKEYIESIREDVVF